MKKILAISGSTRENSANKRLLRFISTKLGTGFSFDLFNGIDILPHFNPDLDKASPPKEVMDFRNQIKSSDGAIICTPEYVFSLPGSLKNALEWTVSSADFYHKPVALITASTGGEKAHESLCLIMKTLEADFDLQTNLLISGVRGKLKEDGNMDPNLESEIEGLTNAFLRKVKEI